MDQGLKISRIWDDAELIEFECLVDTGRFRGHATCYAGRGDLETFSDDLVAFSTTFEGRPTFVAGLADGTKAVKIELYAIDRAKHTAARVTLATDRGTRSDEIARLQVEFPV